jgi:hypothetical protein
MIFNFIHSLLNSKIEQTIQVAGIFSFLAGNDNIPDYNYNDLLYEMEGVGIKLSASANKNFSNMCSEMKDKNFTKAKKSLALITGVKKGKTVKLQTISKILIEFALNIKEGNAKTKKK